MNLEVDLRVDDARPRPSSDGTRVVGLDEFARAVKQPLALPPLLWMHEYRSVTVLENGNPPSVTETVLGLLVGTVRSRTITVEARGEIKTITRSRYIARALWRLGAAVLDEVANSPRLYVIARMRARHLFRLPKAVSHPNELVYLRVEPSLRWLGSYVGGAATHTTGVVTGFRANGLTLNVVAPERPDGIGAVPVFEVPFRHAHRFFPGLTYVDYSLAIRSATRSCTGQFVYQRYALGSCAGLELAERLGVPLVLEFNGSELWIERHWGSGGIRLRGLLEAIERRNLRDASLVVVVSEALRQAVVAAGIPESKVLVNPNGVDADAMAAIRARSAAEWRTRLELADAATVGFIGTFGLWHGVTVLPDIIERLAERRPDTRWILIGDGSLRPNVVAEVERRRLTDIVIFTGLIDHEQALELLGACDVCISPHVPNPDGSPFFGSPTKLFEYMGLAKPIVASDLAQIGEVIEHERTGLLCPPGDATAAADAVERLLSDPQLRRALGEAALDQAARQYSWKAHTQRILAALQP